MKKTMFVLLALALVIAALAGGTAFLLRQKHLGQMGRLSSQAEDKLNSKSYDQAISMLKKVEADGGSDRSTYLLGRAFTEQGKFQDANRYFNDLLKEYPKSPFAPDARLALAKQALKSNKLDSSQHLLLEILGHSPNSAAADHALVLLADISLRKKDEVQARKNLEIVLRKKNSPAKSEAEFLIGDLNMKRLKSSELAPGDEVYTIKRGDTLWEMERKLKVPKDLLVGINDLNPSALQIGKQIRIPHLNISVAVNKNDRTLTILNDGDLLKKYHVGLNRNDRELPESNYSVSKKYDKGKDWVNPQTQETVKAGKPGNPFGEKFIELRRDTGISGTDDPDKVGKLVSNGAVIMSNQDVNELYALVQMKTPVIVKGSVDSETSPGN